MKIVERKDRNPMLLARLVEIWEGSVKATHTFLLDEEILHIKQYVPQALKDVPVLLAAENENGDISGFMGIAD